MAAANYQSCLAFTLRFEGGNSDNPADPGGRTRKGITQHTYDAFRDRWGLARQDVYAMPDSEMETIYRNEYWNVVKGDTLRPGEDLCVFDFAVNSGPSKAKSFLAMSGGAADAAADVIDKICESRLTFLRSLKTWETFGPGWSKRVTACQATALKMAEVLVMPPQVPAHPVQVPKAPIPVPAAPVPPAGLPPILSTSAGRIASGTDTLVAMRDARIAELISADPEIAAYDAALAAFHKLTAAPIQPQADTSAATQGTQTMTVQAVQPKTVLGMINWKTAISGVVAAVAGVAKVIPALQPYSDILNTIMSVAIGAGLISAKDNNVTGGTVPQTVEAATRASSMPIK